jgi:hypothetical protein
MSGGEGASQDVGVESKGKKAVPFYKTGRPECIDSKPDLPSSPF